MKGYLFSILIASIITAIGITPAIGNSDCTCILDSKKVCEFCKDKTRCLDCVFRIR